MNRRFRELARAMGAREPDALGDSLMLLWEGSHLARLTFKSDRGPEHGAANAARLLIAAHTDKPWQRRWRRRNGGGVGSFQMRAALNGAPQRTSHRP
jgi:hypothetical protein